MRETGCNRLVFSSTGAVYGNAGRDPISEDAAGSPVNPYGVSKWMIEQILADFRAAYRLGSTCLRYFNASGAEKSASIGEFRDPETHLIPRAMMALQGLVDDFAISATTMIRPTERRSAIISMSRIWQPPIFWRSSSC